MEEQEDGQGPPRRNEPRGHGVRRGRRAHLRLLGTVDSTERKGQGRPPEAGRLDGHEEPLHHRRRGVRGRQLPDLEGVAGQDDLQQPGRRPPYPARRQRQGLHREDDDGAEPQGAEDRLLLRRRDGGLLPEHRHRGRGPVASLPAMGQTDRAVLQNRVRQVLSLVRVLHRHPDGLQDLRQTAEGCRQDAGARRAADDGGVLRGLDDLEGNQVSHAGTPWPQGRGREVGHADRDVRERPPLREGRTAQGIRGDAAHEGGHGPGLQLRHQQVRNGLLRQRARQVHRSEGRHQVGHRRCHQALRFRPAGPENLRGSLAGAAGLRPALFPGGTRKASPRSEAAGARGA